MRTTTCSVGWYFALTPFVQLFAGSFASAQNNLQGDALRETYQLGGLGVVGREVAGEISCDANDSGGRGIELLESIGGSVVAELEQRQGDFGCQVFLVRDGESERLRRGWDLPEISYESVGLVYYEELDGFARVLEHTVPPGLWVRVADMRDGRLHPWPELFVESRHLYLGYDGHELHLEPSEDSPVLVTLRDRRVHETRVHQLIPTGSLSGDWGEFDVIEFDSEFYTLARTREPSRTGNEWKGWLRLVNGAGAPEFWFFTRD